MKTCQCATVVLDAFELHRILSAAPNIASVLIQVNSIEVPIAECRLVQSFVSQRSATVPPELGLVYEHKQFPVISEGELLSAASFVVATKVPE